MNLSDAEHRGIMMEFASQTVLFYLLNPAAELLGILLIAKNEICMINRSIMPLAKEAFRLDVCHHVVWNEL